MAAYTYDPNNNPEGRYIDGVPLRDLSVDEVAAFLPHIQAAIKAAPFYHAIEERAHFVAVEPAPQPTAELTATDDSPIWISKPGNVDPPAAKLTKRKGGNSL